MLSSTAVRGLGLSVLASSALTLALGSPTQAAVVPAAPISSVAATSGTAATALTERIGQTQVAAAKTKKKSKKSKAAKKKAAKKKAAARKKAYKKAHKKAVRKAKKVGTYAVDRSFVDHRIDASSGLARSTYNRPTLFTHNDNRDGARVFAVNNKGRTRAVIKLKGASRVDWEDMASGPRHTLWVADSGDSSGKRSIIKLHAFTEPKNLPNDGGTVKLKPTTYKLGFNDGSHNIEALLVHPSTGRVHVVSRGTNGAKVYAAPATLLTTTTNRMTAVADAPADITAGSWAPDGRTVVLSSQKQAFTYAAIGGSATVTTLPTRKRGSSVEVSRDGKLLAGSKGRYSPVLRMALPKPPVAPTTTAPTAKPAPTTAPTTAPKPTPTTPPNVLAPDADPKGPASQVNACRAPDYRSTTTLFGASLSAGDGNLQQALATNDALFGKLPVVRQFDPTVPPKGAWSRRTFFNDRTMVVSFREHPREIVKGTYDAQILDYFKNAPTQKPVFWSYFHEPEPHIAKGEFTHAEYRAAWRHVVDLVGTLCRKNLYPTLVLTGWTTEPASKRNWRDYYPGDDYISVVSWDPYNSATGTPTSYPDPTRLFASVLKASKESGKPWGIAETGSALVPGDDGTQRAKWLTKVGKYFDDQGAAWVLYFQSTRDGDFKLRDSASVNAWGEWVKKYD